MNKKDLFLKISIDAYYPLKGNNIKQETVKEGGDEYIEYYLNGKKIEPEIKFYPDAENDLIEDSLALGVDVMTREEIWNEDSDFKIMDDLIAEHSKSKN